MSRLLAVLAATFLVAAFASAPLPVAALPPTPAVANGVIVALKDSATAEQAQSALNAAGATVRLTSPRSRSMLVAVSSTSSAETVARTIAAMPGVRYAEPNRRVSAVAVPNDPMYSAQWGLPAVNAPAAWDDVRASSAVEVAVVDTGAYFAHPDLAGILDSVHDYDFVNSDSDARDDNGHGTHVAGIVAAITNNSLGVASLAGLGREGTTGGVRILPVKVLDENGDGWDSDVALGIRYAADAGARVINLSVGETSPSITLDEAVAYARAKGCVVVAAAGNSGTLQVLYPAGSAGVIGVAAVDSQLQRASFSSSGPHVDVSAPGVGILSTTWPGDPDFVGQQYGTMSGTSMATAFVSAEAALFFSAMPSATGSHVENAILSSARDLGPAGRDDSFGYGIIDAAAALSQLDLTPPTTTVTYDPPEPGSGWWNVPTVTASLESTDSLSGVASIDYWITPPGGVAAYESTTTNPVTLPAFSQEGATTLEFRSVDGSGNVEATRTTTIRIDTHEPMVLSEVGSPAPSVIVTLSASDALSGLKALRYQLDSEPTATAGGGAAILSVTSYGEHTMKWWAEDTAGNTAAGGRTFTVTDEQKPAVTATVLGNGSTSVRVSLSATDTPAGSGIALFQYWIDRGATTVVATETIAGEATTTAAQTTPGSYTLYYCARDNAGNEATGTVPFVVAAQPPPPPPPPWILPAPPPDITAPTVGAAVSPTGWSRGPVTVTLTAGDDSGSATVTYRANGSVSQPYVLPFTWSAEGVTTIGYAATDAAGNSATGSVLVQIDRTQPTAPGAPWYSTLTAHSATLAWAAGSDGLSGVVRYDVYDGAARVASSAGTSFTLTGLSPGSSHSYTLVAVDRADNESSRSPALAVRIPAGEASADIPSGIRVTSSIEVPVADGTASFQIAFSNVSRAGVLVITRTDSPPSPVSANAGTGFLGQYFNISFGGSFSGTTTVTFPYDARIPDARAKNLRIRHWVDAGWQDVPVSVDVVKHTITAQLTSLSTLALAENASVNRSTRLIAVTSRIAPAYGQPAAITVRLVDASSTALPLRVVKIQVSRDNKTWSKTATMTAVAKSPGSYAIKVRPLSMSGITYVRASFADDGINDASARTLTLLPKASLTAPAVAASRTRTTTLSGYLRPAHAGPIVLEIQQQVSRTRWRTVATVKLRTTSAGRWSTRRTFTKGTFRMRVTHVDASHSASASAWKWRYVR